ncbi:MAG: hypothetical protein HY782_02235 [Chloroflexi bacterium]|nr:hypothetical protein [Chloroflexota bacterium]
MNETHLEYLRVGFAFSWAFALLSVPLSILAALLAYLLLGSPHAAALVATCILLSAGLVIAGVLILSLKTSQAMLTDLVASHLDRVDGRHDRITLTQTHVDARGVGNNVEVNHAPVEKIENTRILVMHKPYPQVEGLPKPALAFFIDQFPIRGWGEREWVDTGMRLPGMKDEVNYDTWRQMPAAIEKVEGIAPVRPRHKIKPILPLETIKRKLLGDGTDDEGVTDH